jgi:elongation factor G
MGQSARATGTPNAQKRSRAIAIIGPYLSGKTTLLEAILARTGAIPRQGTIADKSTLGDSSPEARDHGMSVELNLADVDFLDDHFTFIDCPGSIEFQHEGALALTACDAAIVVSEPDAKRVPALQVILKDLEDRGIPHFLFLNKIDNFSTPVRDIIPVLQPASTKPLVLRQIPIWENGAATGFVDLASERAYHYNAHQESDIIDLPSDLAEREKDARFSMLEHLADYDDDLMEKLLSDISPDKELVFNDLTTEFADGLICPVLLGSAENGNGILRLLKAIRHEVPSVEQTAKRLGLETAEPAAYIFKSTYTGHGGKLSIARQLTGEVKEGATLTGSSGNADRTAGLFSVAGGDISKLTTAKPGDTVAFARLDSIPTGDIVTTNGTPLTNEASPAEPEHVLAFGLGLKDRKDEVKLSQALAKLTDEDPSLSVLHDPDTHQVLLRGQGEMHLRVTLERLARKYGINVTREKQRVPYKETIRKPIEVRGKHKKQSGGHGQFGDVVLEIKPLPRGSGFQFSDKITGGVVPKQYIPSVEHGVQDYLSSGPLGFPVVDVAVTLLEGSFHSVDSNDMAFRSAGRLAMSEGMPQCQPVLLEPVMSVEVAVPSEATPKVNSIISQRRGQILGFDARPGWDGWDVVQAHIPQAEIDDLIVELRSATAGVGTYQATFDHLAELTGRLADQALHATQDAAE